MADPYRVIVGSHNYVTAEDVMEAYGIVGELKAFGSLPAGTEIRIVFVADTGREHTVSINWVRK